MLRKLFLVPTTCLILVAFAVASATAVGDSGSSNGGEEKILISKVRDEYPDTTVRCNSLDDGCDNQVPKRAHVSDEGNCSQAKAVIIDLWDEFALSVADKPWRIGESIIVDPMIWELCWN